MSGMSDDLSNVTISLEHVVAHALAMESRLHDMRSQKNMLNRLVREYESVVDALRTVAIECSSPSLVKLSLAVGKGRRGITGKLTLRVVVISILACKRLERFFFESKARRHVTGRMKDIPARLRFSTHEGVESEDEDGQVEEEEKNGANGSEKASHLRRKQQSSSSSPSHSQPPHSMSHLQRHSAIKKRWILPSRDQLFNHNADIPQLVLDAARRAREEDEKKRFELAIFHKLHQQQQQQQQQHRLISGKFVGKKGKSWKSRDDELHSMDDLAFEVQMHSKVLHSSTLVEAIQRHSSSSSRNLFIESDDDNDDELRSDNGDEVLTDFSNSGLRFTPLNYSNNNNNNNNSNSISGVRAKSSASKTFPKTSSSSYFTSFKVADIFGWVPLVAIRRFVRSQKRDMQTYKKNAILAKEEIGVLTETNAHLTAAIDVLTAKDSSSRVSPQSVIKLVNQHLAAREANKELYEPYTPTTVSPKSGFLTRRFKGGGVDKNNLDGSPK